ncbi:MAG: hypothetical protein CM1200mP20_01290 [Pseudomonadota bacterium]|nr:MAG: hypothetical protein CM1200mP20_01290 [Pseudomonadota bacterium]
MTSSLFDAMLLVVFVFLLAGFVKGVIGFGLPTVSVSLLTAFQGLEAAIVIMLYLHCCPMCGRALWAAIS